MRENPQPPITKEVECNMYRSGTPGTDITLRKEVQPASPPEFVSMPAQQERRMARFCTADSPSAMHSQRVLVSLGHLMRGCRTFHRTSAEPGYRCQEVLILHCGGFSPNSQSHTCATSIDTWRRRRNQPGKLLIPWRARQEQARVTQGCSKVTNSIPLAGTSQCFGTWTLVSSCWRRPTDTSPPW